MAKRLVKLADLKEFVGIEGETVDAWLMTWLDLFAGRVEDYLDRTLEKAQYTETHWAEGHSVWVRAFPIDTGQSITLLDDGATVSADEYVVRSSDRSAAFTLKWRAFSRRDWPSVTVTYTGGYAVADGVLSVPDAIKRATLLQGMFEFKNRESLGLTSLSMAGTSVALAPARLLAEVKDLLEPYRRLTVG